MQNRPFTFDWHYIKQKLGEDFAKFCGLLRIYELYYYDTSGRLVFVRFLEEIEDTKKTFQN